jgi:hypothetical protein
MRVLNELLMNPMVTVVAPPHFSKDQPASDRSSRNDDRPKMPNFRPGGFCIQAQNLKIITAQGFHRGPPLHSLMLGLRQLRDVVAGGLERDELAAARRRYRIVKLPFPTAGLSRSRAVAVSSPDCTSVVNGQIVNTTCNWSGAKRTDPPCPQHHRHIRQPSRWCP